MTDPASVNSPKSRIEGPIEVVVNTQEDGYAIARMKYDGEPSLCIRWNGHGDRPKGYPVSQGHPTWFRLPDEVARVVEASIRLGLLR